MSAPKTLTVPYSRHFLEWLHQHQVSVALTTYQTNRLCLIGVQPNGQISTPVWEFERPMGLYVTSERFYLATRYQIWRFENVLENGEILKEKYDRLYVPRVAYTTGDLDVHDLIADPQGNIIFANTEYSCLATLHPQHSFTPIWKPNFISKLAPEDRCHLNGLAALNGIPRYVTAVSHSDVASGWRHRRSDGGVVIDIQTHDIIARGLSMPHSPRWYQGKLWLLNSGTGDFGYIENGEFVPVTFCPGYGRGLAFVGDFAVVGLSKPRDYHFSGLLLGEKLQQKQAEARCGILIIDLKTGDIVEWLDMDTEATELYDVAIFPQVQCPMALGFKSGNIAKLVTIGSPTKTQKKVISFSLWGHDPIYNIGAIKNAELALKIYPGWICRFYVDETVPKETLERLSAWNHVEIIPMQTPSQNCTGSFWRFLALNDPDVEITIIRDTDSRLNQREKAAVDEWLASPFPFHIMRDHPLHRSKIMGGMWGFKGNLEIKTAINNYVKTHSKSLMKGIDQRFLNDVIYPLAQYQSLVHDEFYGGQPFPISRQNTEYVGQIFREDETTISELDEILEQHLRKVENPQLKVAKAEFERGQDLKKQGKFEQAIACFQNAITADPTYIPAHNNLGTLFQNQNYLDQAITCYQNALNINPNSTLTLTNLGSIYLIEGQLNQAEELLKRALELNPELVPALYNLGLLYKQQAKLDEAIQLFQTAAKHQRDYADAYFELGQIWEFQSQFILAKLAYERVQKLNPNAQYLLSHIGFVKLNLCDWENYDSFIEQLIDSTTQYIQEENGGVTLAPFQLNALPIPPELSLAFAQKHAAGIEKSIAEKKPKFIYSQKTDKLRVGYVSPDFYSHAVGRLIYQIFENHNRDEFEIFGYNLLNVNDEVTEMIKNGCDQFRDISQLPAVDAAVQINADGIDILIDLAGYTGYSKPQIFAYQPAPIQASFLGYPNTMGANFIQYLLTDEWVVPANLAKNYSESIIYLPHQFICSPMEISNQQFIRAEFGLPEDGFVFVCCNRHFKITPDLFAVWMRILQQVEGSVLWLSEPTTEEVINNLHKKAAASGIAPERLIFVPKIPHPEYLARLQLADLALDTWIYSGGSTTVAALWAGVPVLTKPGLTNASRMGASICASGGLPEMIANSVEEYEQKAIDWATHPQELQQLRQRLKARDAPLFNISGFVSHLEEAFRQMGNR
ncbi:TIGR03032 family protein [Planktothrix agardhii]|uniref:TIGR03032 family protein n=1 Tax=Planktothrix agardhii TaxID=1160 RepID=UPI0020A799FE|nr:TIGR03032 family protein [Planktothrix agardhii]CAD5949363.1 putative UDP-N-acetylglucosamine--peptide N-acetylglucosaminyltransferase SEC [Planktothrix agardhii]